MKPVYTVFDNLGEGTKARHDYRSSTCKCLKDHHGKTLVP